MTDFLLEETRARWRLTVHHRSFAAGGFARTTGIAELSDARSRRLETSLNSPAKLTFSVAGGSPSAAYVRELQTDVMAWRFDPEDGRDHLMFRGIVAQSEDTLTEQAHTVNFTVHDYLAVINRRYLNPPTDLVYSQVDQDVIVADLLQRATFGQAPAGANSNPGGGPAGFQPGAYVPLQNQLQNPDGTNRSAWSGVLRDRTYTGGSSCGELITALGAVINGFDVDVLAAADVAGRDFLRVWYPARGVGRTDLALVYGSTVSALTRSANSAVDGSGGGYANYVRVLGDNSAEPEGSPQLIAEAWTPESNDVGAVPVGLWAATDNQSDVSQAATLQQKAAGDIQTLGSLTPSYSLTLRPGWYRPGFPALGDTVPLVVKSGRLDVSTTVRVLGLNYAIGDDGQEDVEMVVGRAAEDLSAQFRKTRRDVDALARR
jgi:hypothetical protein